MFVESTGEADLLGQLLRRRQAVDEVTLQAAMEEQSASGELLGAVLRRHGVPAHVIDHALWQQAEASSRHATQMRIAQAVTVIGSTLGLASARASRLASASLFGVVSGLLSFPVLFYFFSGWAWSMLGMAHAPAEVSQVTVRFLGLVLVVQLLDVLSAAQVTGIVADLRRRLTIALHHRVSCAPVQRHHGKAVHEVTPVLSHSLDQFASHTEVLLTRGPRAAGTLLGFAVIFMASGATTNTFILVFAGLSLALPAVIGTRAQKYQSEEPRQLALAFRHIEPFYIHFRTTLNRIDLATTQLRKHLVDHHRNQLGKWMVWSWAFNLRLTLNNFTAAAISIAGGWQVISGSMALADYFKLTLAIMLILPRLGDLYDLYRSVKFAAQHGTVIGRELRQFHLQAPAFIDEPPVRLSVRSDGVQTHESRILVGLQHDFRPGRLTLIVGPSGCGKSTLSRLIAGLGSDPAVQVEIAYGSGLSTRNALGQVALLGQDHTFLNSDDLASAVSDRAGAGSQVHQLLARMGIDVTPSRGRSGAGQWPAYSRGELQRVHLLRGLLSNRRIRIFDEPTSSLDVPSARVVHAMLEDVPADEIRIVITHDAAWASPRHDRLDLAAHLSLT